MSWFKASWRGVCPFSANKSKGYQVCIVKLKQEHAINKKAITYFPVYPAPNGSVSCTVLHHPLHLRPVLSSSLSSEKTETFRNAFHMILHIFLFNIQGDSLKNELLFSSLCHQRGTANFSPYLSSFSSSFPWVCPAPLIAHRKTCLGQSFPLSPRFQTLLTPVLMVSRHSLSIPREDNMLIHMLQANR